MTLLEAAALATLVLNLVIAVVMGTWGMGKLRASITEDVAKIREVIRSEMEQQFLKRDNEIEGVRREFGEVAAAIRGKVNEIELYIRDNYVRRQSFYEVTEKLGASIDKFCQRMDLRFERMEAKIDTQTK